MSNSQDEFKRTFTVEEANATLPLVKAICQDLSSLSQEVVERKERLSMLLAGRDEDQDNLYRQELVQIEEELERDTSRIGEYIEELRDLGVEPKGGVEGLVDFPSLMDGRVVFLCWKLDEPEILHWHELKDGFQGRQPLVVGTSSTPSIDRGDCDEAESSS